MWPEVGATDFPATCTSFKVPYFIFDGRLDQNTPAELVQGYFDLIEAPRKELVWFEGSGHNPMNDEPGIFKELLCLTLSTIGDRENKA
jgi:pimeloyl-ACP methyl ester carboxylesterase